METGQTVNERQKAFYNTKKKNLPTKIWSFIRGGLLNKMRKQLGVQQQTYETHKQWLGEISKMKVLDLGCFSGNYLTLYLAENSANYIGIDLSDVAIKKLSEKLAHIPTARAIAIDFLSDEFTESNFDIIYAYGVLHHFKDTDGLITRLKSKLKPDGIVISYDPLQTSLPLKIMRWLYRPFQSDAAWEWPFTKKIYFKFEKAFTVNERRGVLGKSKWVFLLNFLPLSAKKKIKIAKNWHQTDWEFSKTSDKHLFRCMHITMLLKNS